MRRIALFISPVPFATAYGETIGWDCDYKIKRYCMSYYSLHRNQIYFPNYKKAPGYWVYQ
jgi:hypothetical protein